MTAYYNEIDPKAAAWLRELIKQGHIASGEVDERSIVDVKPDDLRKFTQCHFFAGIGVWSYALRRSGWEDDRPVWTGSCPCQPFSAAGKGNGFADERHLWPAFFHLIEAVKPRTVFGEQVASKDGLGWLDLVQADLEGKGYAFGAIDTCAAGFGAPHIRQRLYWVADSDNKFERSTRQYGARIGNTLRKSEDGELADTVGAGLQGYRRSVEEPVSEGRQGEEGYGSEICGVVGMGNTCGATSERNAGKVSGTQEGKHSAGIAVDGDMPIGFKHAGPSVGGMADAKRNQEHEEQPRPAENERGRRTDEPSECSLVDTGAAASPTNGFWRDADWLFCRDGKWRPAEPGTFPLAHGDSARVGRLRGYGNAINAAQAEGFITAFMEEVA